MFKSETKSTSSNPGVKEYLSSVWNLDTASRLFIPGVEEYLRAQSRIWKKNQGKLVLLDRHWPSEQCYSYIYRSGPSYNPKKIYEFLRNRGALYVWCIPEDTQRVKDNHRINREKRHEEYHDIDDVVNCIEKICFLKSKSNFQILNIGNSKPVQTIKLVSTLEKLLNKKAKKKYLKKNKEDSVKTSANTGLIEKKYKVKINTKLEEGLKKFINWYKFFFNLKIQTK